MNESDFAAQFARDRHSEGLWRVNLDILPEKVVERHVEDETKGVGIEGEESMPKV